MKDLYLKFTSEQEFLSILEQNNLLSEIPVLDEDNNPTEQTTSIPICFYHDYAMDIIGEIPGKEGYHVNLRAINMDFDTSSFEPFQVFPKTPSVIWS